VTRASGGGGARVATHPMAPTRPTLHRASKGAEAGPLDPTAWRLGVAAAGTRPAHSANACCSTRKRWPGSERPAPKGRQTRSARGSWRCQCPYRPRMQQSQRPYRPRMLQGSRPKVAAGPSLAVGAALAIRPTGGCAMRKEWLRSD